MRKVILHIVLACFVLNITSPAISASSGVPASRIGVSLFQEEAMTAAAIAFHWPRLSYAAVFITALAGVLTLQIKAQTSQAPTNADNDTISTHDARPYSPQELQRLLDQLKRHARAYHDAMRLTDPMPARGTVIIPLGRNRRTLSDMGYQDALREENKAKEDIQNYLTMRPKVDELLRWADEAKLGFLKGWIKEVWKTLNKKHTKRTSTSFNGTVPESIFDVFGLLAMAFSGRNQKRHSLLDGPLIIPITKTIFAVPRELMADNIMRWNKMAFDIIKHDLKKESMRELSRQHLQAIDRLIPTTILNVTAIFVNTDNVPVIENVKMLLVYLYMRGICPAWDEPSIYLWAFANVTPGTIIVSFEEILKGLPHATISIEHEKRHRFFQTFTRYRRSELSKLAHWILKRSSFFRELASNVKQDYYPSDRAQEILIRCLEIASPENLLIALTLYDDFTWAKAGFTQKRARKTFNSLHTLYQAGRLTSSERESLRQVHTFLTRPLRLAA